jgi:hypothetical protein
MYVNWTHEQWTRVQALGALIECCSLRVWKWSFMLKEQQNHENTGPLDIAQTKDFWMQLRSTTYYYNKYYIINANAVKVHYINVPNKSFSSLISMGVRFRCGAQDSNELRLNFLAVISFSVIRVMKVLL